MKKEGKENEEELKQIEYKFILLGDSSVGKSSIFRRLSGKSFTENMISTIGLEKIIIDFNHIVIDENESQNFKILLFDTAGQERYRSITRSYFKGSQGIILLYSIEDETSFKHIETWLDSIKESLSDWKRSGYIIMLLGNKLDLAEEDPETRMIMAEEGENICSEKGIYWGGECSAKTFDESQLKEIFAKFIKQVYNKLGEEKKDNEKKNQQIVLISNKLNDKKRVKCCTPK